MKTEMQRVDFFLPSLEGGGAEKSAVVLANQLSSMGFQVGIILVKAEGPLLAAVSPSVEVVSLGKRRVRSSLWALVRLLSMRRPSVVLSFLTHANIVAALAKKLCPHHFRLILSQHSVISHQNLRQLRIGGQPLKRIASLCYPLADHIIAVSEGVRNDLLKLLGLPPEQIGMIHNPVNIDQVQFQAQANVGHRWLRKGGDRPFVLLVGVGRLVPDKHFDVFLRAVAKIAEKTQVKALILGDGPMRDELVAYADYLGLGSDVEFLGFQGNPYPYIAGSDCLIMSSQSEAFSVVLVEALAVGCPVVATDCDFGPREILAGGQFGRLAEVGDSNGLAVSALATLRKPISPVILKQRASKYDATLVAAQYARVFFPDWPEISDDH